MRAFALSLGLACVFASAGCGTVGNTLGPRQYSHVYGGLEFDYLAMQGTWSETKLGEGKTRRPLERERISETILATSLIAIDVPLSFVGDTITLPAILLFSGCRGWDLGKNEIQAEHVERSKE